MIEVRFPTGVVVVYRTATQVVYHEQSQSWRLLTKEGGSVVAVLMASAGCIIELEKPVSVENPLVRMTGETALEYVVSHLREFGGWHQSRLLKRLKSEMGAFDARDLTWKDE